MQRLGRFSAEHVDGAGDGAVVPRLLLAAETRRVEDGGDEQRPVARIAQVLHVRVEGAARVRDARIRLQHTPRVRLHETEAVVVAAFEVGDREAAPREARVEAEMTLTRTQVHFRQQRLGRHVVQFEDVARRRRHGASRRRNIRHLDDALGFVRTQSAGENLVDELDALFPEDAHELVAADVEQPELRRGVAREVERDEAVPETDDALDPEVVDGGELRRDVVVLEVLRHLGELGALAEGEEGGTLVDVDDALATHAERVAAVLVDRAVA